MTIIIGRLIAILGKMKRLSIAGQNGTKRDICPDMYRDKTGHNPIGVSRCPAVPVKTEYLLTTTRHKPKENKMKDVTEKKQTFVVTITGGVSTGKSCIAKAITNNAISNGLLIREFNFYTHDKHYEKKISELKKEAATTDLLDVCLIVINTGSNNKLNIDFQGGEPTYYFRGEILAALLYTKQ